MVLASFGDVVAATRAKNDETYASIGSTRLGRLAITSLARSDDVDIVHVR